MKPIVFAVRRPVATLLLVAALVSGGVYRDSVGARARQIAGYVAGQLASYSHEHEVQAHHEQHNIVVTSPKAKDVVLTDQYVCQIHSQRHINVRALENG